MLRSQRSIGLLLAIGMFATICEPAAAYIDAGSGSYLLQILFATMFGAAFTVKSTFRNVKAAVVRRMGHKAPAVRSDRA